MSSNLPFRPNVCLLIMNSEHLLFLGERLGCPGVWQFPQGGAKEKYSLAENALREAHEELGVDKELLKVIGKFACCHQYDFDIVPDYAVGRWRGQAQTFWLISFLGEDKDIKLNLFTPEFSAWRWCTSEDVRGFAEGKRLAGYEGALAEFEEYLEMGKNSSFARLNNLSE